MSSVTITIANIRSILNALSAKGYYNDDFTIKIVDAGTEITVRDANDMFIDQLAKTKTDNSNSFSNNKNRFR